MTRAASLIAVILSLLSVPVTAGAADLQGAKPDELLKSLVLQAIAE